MYSHGIAPEETTAINPFWGPNLSAAERKGARALVTLIQPGENYLLGRQTWVARIPVVGEWVFTSDGQQLRVVAVMLTEIEPDEPYADAGNGRFWPDALVHVEPAPQASENDRAAARLYVAKDLLFVQSDER
jgi:hypothetical protein